MILYKFISITEDLAMPAAKRARMDGSPTYHSFASAFPNLAPTSSRDLLRLYGIHDADVAEVTPLNAGSILSVRIRINTPIDFFTAWPNGPDLLRDLIPKEAYARYSALPLRLDVLINHDSGSTLGISHPDFPERAWDLSQYNLTAADLHQINASGMISPELQLRLAQDKSDVKRHFKVCITDQWPFLVLAINGKPDEAFQVNSNYFVFSSSAAHLNDLTQTWIHPYPNTKYRIILRHHSTYDPSGYHPNPARYPLPDQRNVLARNYEDGLCTERSISAAHTLPPESIYLDDATGPGTLMFLARLAMPDSVKTYACDRDPLARRMVQFNAEALDMDVSCITPEEKQAVHPDMCSSNAPSWGNADDCYVSNTDFDSGLIGLDYYLNHIHWLVTRQKPCKTFLWNRAIPENNDPLPLLQGMSNKIRVTQEPEALDPESPFPTAPILYEVETKAADVVMGQDITEEEIIDLPIKKNSDLLSLFYKIFTGQIIVPTKYDALMDKRLSVLLAFDDSFYILPYIMECIAKGHLRVGEGFLTLFESKCFGEWAPGDRCFPRFYMETPPTPEALADMIKHQNIYVRFFSIPEYREHAIKTCQDRFFLGGSIRSEMVKHCPFSIFSEPMTVKSFQSSSSVWQEFENLKGRLSKGKYYSFLEGNGVLYVMNIEKLIRAIDRKSQLLFTPSHYDIFNIGNATHMVEYTDVIFHDLKTGTYQTHKLSEIADYDRHADSIQTLLYYANMHA